MGHQARFHLAESHSPPLARSGLHHEGGYVPTGQASQKKRREAGPPAEALVLRSFPSGGRAQGAVDGGPARGWLHAAAGSSPRGRGIGAGATSAEREEGRRAADCGAPPSR